MLGLTVQPKCRPIIIKYQILQISKLFLRERVKIVDDQSFQAEHQAKFKLRRFRGRFN